MADSRIKIPEVVRRALRAEVGFGCPVEGCGSPYLSFHHFDPPYHIEQHNRPDGMIAFCLEHHKQADSGAFTKKQIRDYKKNPYLVNNSSVSGKFNWKREQLIVKTAGFTSIGVKDSILVVRGVPIISISKDEKGYEAMNLNILAKDGSPLFQMNRNDWTVFTPLDDIICPSSARTIDLRSKSMDFKLRIEFKNFDHISQALSQKELQFIEASNHFHRNPSTIKDDDVTVCSISGNLIWPIKFQIEENLLKFNEIQISNNFTISSQNAIILNM